MDDELLKEVADDKGYDIAELAKRWVDPFNIVIDLFGYRNILGEYVQYAPYDYTLQFFKYGFEHMNTDRCILKSRQIGFSTAAILEAIVTIMTFDNQEVAIVSNQFSNAKKLMVEAGKIIRESKYSLPFNKRDIQIQKITSNTDSYIVPYSSNPDSIRGGAAIRIYLDEFAFVQDQESTMDAIVPKLSRGGHFTMISTPLRKDDLFMQTYNDMNNGIIDGVTMNCPLFDENEIDYNIPLTLQNLTPICPDIDINRVEKTRAGSIDRFKQEYMCIAIDDISAFYPLDLIMSCTKDEPIFDKRNYDNTIIMGLDHALVHDSTVVVINQITHDNRNEIIHVEKLENDYHKQLRRIENLFTSFNVNKIRVDSTGEMGVNVERDLKSRYGYKVEGVKFTLLTKNDMALRLKYLMQNTRAGISPSIHLPDNRDLINEINSMRIELTEHGNERFTGKYGGGSDDMVDALWLSLPPEIDNVMTSACVRKSDVYQDDISLPYNQVIGGRGVSVNGVRKLRQRLIYG